MGGRGGSFWGGGGFCVGFRGWGRVGGNSLGILVG